MLLFYLGEIISVDIRERKDKTTGEVTYNLVANIALKIKDRNGKPKLIADDIVMPYEYKDMLEKSEGKYILIPHNYLKTKDNTYLFVDENYIPIFFDSNPLESKPIKKSA